jgi:hypothetical protein
MAGRVEAHPRHGQDRPTRLSKDPAALNRPRLTLEPVMDAACGRVIAFCMVATDIKQ